jgi:hypothetical protein
VRFLTSPPPEQFSFFLSQVRAAGADAELVKDVGNRAVAWAGGERKKDPDPTGLIARWYASLERGEPDYSVYAEDAYLGDLWGGWVYYSRPYVQMLAGVLGRGGPVGEARKHLTPLLRGYGSIADLGCGFGYTTAALREAYPDALVTGTNFPDTVQTRVAALNGVETVPGINNIPTAEVVFASEYFEHIEAPLAHLDEIVEQLHPRLLILANSFGTRSIGHFTEYRVSGRRVDQYQMTALFHRRLRHLGYQQQETGFWNNRPALWGKNMTTNQGILW